MRQTLLATLLALAAVVGNVSSLPVIVKTTSTTEPPAAAAAAEAVADAHDSPEEQLSYSRYLQEIVQALETDEDFRKKLSDSEQVDIRVSAATKWTNLQTISQYGMIVL